MSPRPDATERARRRRRRLLAAAISVAAVAFGGFLAYETVFAGDGVEADTTGADKVEEAEAQGSTLREREGLERPVTGDTRTPTEVAAGEPGGSDPPLLDVDVGTDSLQTEPGRSVTLRIVVSRGGGARSGVELVLDGSERLPGVDRRLEATTDDAGVAVFRVPVGDAPGVYTFRVLARGFWLRGSTRVVLDVAPAEPSGPDAAPPAGEVTGPPG